MSRKHLKKCFFVFIMMLITIQSALSVEGYAMERSPSIEAGGEDIPEWAQEEIRSLREDGLIQGYEDGSFKPDKPISRAELVAMLTRMFSSEENASDSGDQSMPFSDLQGEWSADAVVKSVRAGWVQGFPDGTFRPNQPVNRQETAVILNRILKLSRTGNLAFHDKDSIPAWAAPSVIALTEASVISGYPDGTFRGEQKLTRAEAAVLLYRVRSDMNKPAESRLLTVQALDPSSSPLADAYIFVREQGKKSMMKAGKTGADGKAMLAVSQGAYEITLQKEDLIGYQAFTFSPGAAPVIVKAEKAAILSGTVTGKDGNPAAGIILSFTTNPTFIAVTNALGQYKGYVLPERTYQLTLLDDAAFRDRYKQSDSSLDPIGFVNESISSLQFLDGAATNNDACGCERHELHRTITSPKADETVDIGNLSLVNVNPIISSGGGGSFNDRTDRTAPAVPTGLQAIPGIGKIELTWTAVTAVDLDHYSVYVSMDGGGTWNAALSSGIGTQYTVNGLTYGAKYTFAVTAVDKSGNESVRSASVMAAPYGPQDPITPNPLSIHPVFAEEYSVVRNVYRQGGVLETTDANGIRYKLTIPDGALESDETITMTPIAEIDDFPMSGGLTAGVRLQPDGLYLSKPAELIITLPGAITPEEDRALTGFAFQGAGEETTLYPIIAGSNEISLKVSHFSGYGAGMATGADMNAITDQTPSAPQSRMANSIAEAVQNQVGGDALAALFERLFTSEVMPALDAAIANPDTLPTALQAYFFWGHWASLLGLEELVGEKAGLAADKIKQALRAALELAGTRCYVEKDPAQVFTMLNLARFAALLGFEPEDELSDRIFYCLHFRIEMQVETEASATGTYPYSTPGQFDIMTMNARYEGSSSFAIAIEDTEGGAVVPMIVPRFSFSGKSYDWSGEFPNYTLTGPMAVEHGIRRPLENGMVFITYDLNYISDLDPSRLKAAAEFQVAFTAPFTGSEAKLGDRGAAPDGISGWKTYTVQINGFSPGEGDVYAEAYKTVALPVESANLFWNANAATTISGTETQNWHIAIYHEPLDPGF